MNSYDTLDAVEAAFNKPDNQQGDDGFSCIITKDVAIEFMEKHYGAEGDQNIDDLPYTLMHPSGEYSEDEDDDEDQSCLLFTDTQQGDLCDEIPADNEDWKRMARQKATPEQIKEFVQRYELWQVWTR